MTYPISKGPLGSKAKSGGSSPIRKTGIERQSPMRPSTQPAPSAEYTRVNDKYRKWLDKTPGLSRSPLVQGPASPDALGKEQRYIAQLNKIRTSDTLSQSGGCGPSGLSDGSNDRGFGPSGIGGGR